MTANRQITHNAAVNFVAWHLSRRGWYVQHRILDARRSDLYVQSADKNKSFSVQTRGLSGNRTAVGLGKRGLQDLPGDWWVIMISVYGDAPTCYILRRSEVVQLASTNDDGSQWLEPRDYGRDEYREAWNRIGIGTG